MARSIADVHESMVGGGEARVAIVALAAASHAKSARARLASAQGVVRTALQG